MKYLLLLVAAVNLVLAQKPFKVKSYEGYKVYRVEGYSDELYMLDQELQEQDDEAIITEHHYDHLAVMVSPDLQEMFDEILQKRALSSKLIYNDFSEIIRDEKLEGSRKKSFSWTSYYDVDEIYNYLRNVSKTYPDSTQLVVGGRSYEGREILGLRILSTHGNRIAKPAFFIESGIHAREWITPATTTYFINQLLTSSDPNITRLRDSFDWHIFPTVNPDGYHFTHTQDRMWRKTRSKSTDKCFGADPNRNWEHNWGVHGISKDPCNYQVYCGSEAFSEVETRTLSDYIANIEDLLVYVAFHADAQMLLVPYSDSTSHDDNYDDLIQIGKTSLAYGKRVNGAEYEGPATAAEILYKASGGSMDWVREALGTQIVYTYELRGYYFHWPAYLIYQQGDEVTQMMLGLADEARNLGYF